MNSKKLHFLLKVNSEISWDKLTAQKLKKHSLALFLAVAANMVCLWGGVTHHNYIPTEHAAASIVTRLFPLFDSLSISFDTKIHCYISGSIKVVLAQIQIYFSCVNCDTFLFLLPSQRILSATLQQMLMNDAIFVHNHTPY